MVFKPETIVHGALSPVVTSLTSETKQDTGVTRLILSVEMVIPCPQDASQIIFTLSPIGKHHVSLPVSYEIKLCDKDGNITARAFPEA